jgi:hypothetical protein
VTGMDLGQYDPAMDLGQYGPATIDRAETQIATEMKLSNLNRYEAAAFLARVFAQLIADDLLAGVHPWQSRLDEYQYLRDLKEHLHSQAATNA